jgi:hypothetical protein
MTSQKSLDIISLLLLRYPGVTSAVVFRLKDPERIGIRFRCQNIESLRSIAATTPGSNVSIRLSDPNMRICAESKEASGLPCDISIEDTETDIPIWPERFGVFIAADLERQELITKQELIEYHGQWNTRLIGCTY